MFSLDNNYVFFPIVLVFDILLRVSQGQEWDEAILGVLPPRKFRTGISRRKAKLMLKEAKAEKLENKNEEEMPMDNQIDEPIVENTQI